MSALLLLVSAWVVWILLWVFHTENRIHDLERAVEDIEDGLG